MATVELTKDNFDQTIMSNDIVLVDFWAGWCGPCQMFGPIYEKVSESHSDIVFGKVNTEEEGELAAGFGIMSIPTLMVFREKIMIYNQAGVLPEEGLEELVKKVRELDMDDVRRQIAEHEAQHKAEEEG